MAGHDIGAAAGLGQAEALGLLRALPHGLAVLDEDGRFAFANEACARLLAWPSGAELVGHSWRELLGRAGSRDAGARGPRAGARGRGLAGRGDRPSQGRRSRAARARAAAARRRAARARPRRHLGAACARGAARRARAPRPAHGPAQPPAVRGPPRDRAGAGPPLPPSRRAHLRRPRPLQAGERRLRPRGGGRAAAGGGGAARPERPRGRHRRPPRRRRVHAAPARHPLRRGPRRDLAQARRVAAQALPPARARGARDGERRDQPLSRGRRGRGSAAEERRHRDVPGQGARPRQLPAVLLGDGREGARAALARGQPAQGARQAGADAALPAVPPARDRARHRVSRRSCAGCGPSSA